MNIFNFEKNNLKIDIIYNNIIYFYLYYIFSFYKKKFFININIIDNFDMLYLNSNFNNIIKITDILSFNYSLIDKKLIIGDIYICYYQLFYKSIFFCIPIKTMLLILITHGCLHLLSYNHDTKLSFLNMRNMENFFLQYFKLININ